MNRLLSFNHSCADRGEASFHFNHSGGSHKLPMNKPFTTFIDRLVERLAVLVTRFVSSRVESLQAEIQADHQSHLEDLARIYETEGKTEIATVLRQRAAALTSTDPAADTVETIRCLVEPTTPPNAATSTGQRLTTLPDFASAPPARKPRRKRSADHTVNDGEGLS